MSTHLTLSMIKYGSKVKEWRPPLHLGVVAIERGAFRSPSISVKVFLVNTNNYYLILIIYLHTVKFFHSLLLFNISNSIYQVFIYYANNLHTTVLFQTTIISRWDPNRYFQSESELSAPERSPRTFSKPMYSTWPWCLVQAITRHTCPDPHLGSWNCLPHQAHIAPSEPMSSIDQQGSSLSSFPTFPSLLSPL